MIRTAGLAAFLLAAWLALPTPPAAALTLAHDLTPPATKASNAAGTPPDACRIAPGDYADLPAAQTRQLQKALAYFKLYAQAIDGIVGRETRAGLARYCAERGGGSGRASVDALLQDEEISRVDPGWRDLVAGADFNAWAAAEKDAVQIGEQLAVGSAGQVIGIIARYRSRSAAPAPPLWPEEADVSYTLTAADLKALAADRDALAKLEKMKGRLFPDRTAFRAEIQELLGADAARFRDRVEQHADVLPPAGNEDAHAAPPDSAPGTTDDGSAYRLSDHGWAKLAGATGPLPPYVLVLLREIQEVEFPARRLFALAAAHVVSTLVQRHSEAIQKLVAKRALVRLDDKALEGLKNSGVAAEQLALLSDIKDQPYPTPAKLNAEIGKRFAGAEKQYSGHAELIAALARKTHPQTPDQAVSWTAAPDCHCLPAPKLLKSTVVGFYPFWRAEGEPLPIDFGVFNRIGFYALGVDDHGNILADAQWRNASGKAVATARKYRTGVDLVIGKQDWTAWAAQSEAQREAAFAALAGNIAALVGTPADDGISRLRSRLGLSVPPRGDGITLDFGNFPTDDASIRLFRQLILDLRAKLDPTRQFVNLMFGAEALGSGIYSHANLLRWAQLYGGKNEQGSTVNDHMLFLTRLAEPTADTETRLRLDVEHNLAGASQRRALLRMIIPVITPTSQTAIDDDAVYMEDNFGGIGFWPLPDGKNAQEVVRALKAEYVPQDSAQGSAVCGIVCPNRGGFRLAFDVFLAASLGALGLYLRCCECRATFRRRFIPILAVTVIPVFILGMALLYCDPFLEEVAAGNMPLFLLGLGIIVYAIWSYRQKMRKEIP